MVGREPLATDDPAELGRYRLLGRLGEGGMGVVYLAEDPDGRKVAVKVIRPTLAGHDEFRARFESEITLARKVARFCTAPILDSETSGEQPYVVTEWVDGPTLTEVVRENGPLPGSQLHALGIGVASALTAIHRAGVVHRDLKPSNVLLSRFGPRVIDFGIARAVDAVTSITSTGQIVGTPSYMSPEQLRGEPITPAADLFAWGAVMAFAGTGRLPFGTSADAVAYRVTLGDADLDGLDPHLLDAVRSALQKDPARRPTAQQLLDTLLTTDLVAAEIAGPARRRGRQHRVRWLAGALAVAAAGAAALVALPAGRDGAAPELSAPPTPAAAPELSAPPTPAAAQPVRYDDTAHGPAAAVPGARRGGTVTGLQTEPWPHLDPQRNYAPDAMAAGSALLYRALTGYIDDGKGRLRLVGDLATDTGRSPDGGKTWSYTLRPGVKFEDGTAISAADVAHGVARSFASDVDGGPRYVQNWLAGTAGTGFRQKWAGPYRSDTGPPGVTVDGATITFSFPEPHTEFPMIAALGTTAPVPSGRDSRGAYDRDVVSSGPYRIATHTADTLVLVRNEAWDPATDPIRTAYPDRWVFRSGVDATTATMRLIRPANADSTTFAWTNVPRDIAGEIGTGLHQRALDSATPYSRYLAINNQRVSDVSVRRAVNAAIDRQQALTVFGGASAGVATTTLLPSVMPGYRPHTGLGVPVTGDPAAARRLLGGSTPALTYAYVDDEPNRRLATYLQLTLEKVGFQIKLAAVPSKGAYAAAIRRKDNPYDLYLEKWGSDIPDASGVFPHLYATEGVQASQSTNTAYFLDPLVNQQIRELQAKADRAEAAAGYGALDERLLREHAPIVPLFDERHFSLYGPRLGGLSVGRVLGSVALERAHVLR